MTWVDVGRRLDAPFVPGEFSAFSSALDFIALLSFLPLGCKWELSSV